MNQLALEDSDATKFSSVNRRPRYALAMYQSLHAAASTEVRQSCIQLWRKTINNIPMRFVNAEVLSAFTVTYACGF